MGASLTQLIAASIPVLGGLIIYFWTFCLVLLISPWFSSWFSLCLARSLPLFSDEIHKTFLHIEHLLK